MTIATGAEQASFQPESGELIQGSWIDIATAARLRAPNH